METLTARLRALLACALLGAVSAVQAVDMTTWNTPQAPFKIFGNTYYVGTKGISSILVTSEYGHTLIDGGTPEAAPLIVKNIETLGFKPGEVKAILNTHAHWDHAGGLAALQRLTGAPLYLRRPSEEVLRTGKLTRSDPQFGLKAPAIPPVPMIWIVSDEQLLGVGSNRFQAFATPGHTPGGTTWSWDACEKDKCLRMVYADSLSPVSADSFKFSANKDYAQVLADFELSFKRLESLSCDVLVTPHPEQSRFFERIAQRPADTPAALKDPEGCRRYAQDARTNLAKRLATEK